MLKIIGFVIAWTGVWISTAATVGNYYMGNEIGVAVMAGCTLSTLLVGIYFATYR